MNVSAEINSAVEALDTTLTFEPATIQFRSSCPVRIVGKFFETQQIHVRLFPSLTLVFDPLGVVVVVVVAVVGDVVLDSRTVFLPLVFDQTIQIVSSVLAL